MGKINTDYKLFKSANRDVVGNAKRIHDACNGPRATSRTLVLTRVRFQEHLLYDLSFASSRIN